MRLLALLARGLGATGLEDYEPPAVAIPALLAETTREAAGEPARGPGRADEVAAFIAAAGGEAG